MYQEIKVLDHGYIKLIETWGSDERIIEAARMSTSKGFLGWGPKECPICLKGPYGEGGVFAGRPCENCKGTGQIQGDEKLLSYLWTNQHYTPFEMAGAIIEVQAPIMVFREWHRHRTQSYNELSARYTPMPDMNYVPTVDRCLRVSATNKQAGKIKGAGELTHDQAISWLESLEGVYRHAEEVYQDGLKIGIPKELARLPVPVGRYSRMRASANLRNWLAFLTLRSDVNPGAQEEIRAYGNPLENILATEFPRTLELFQNDGR